MRNTLTVASSQALDDDAAMEAYRRVDEAHARMDRIVTDLWALAQYGRKSGTMELDPAFESSSTTWT